MYVCVYVYLITSYDPSGEVSLVVTVKDTCGQAEELLGHLASIFPKGAPPRDKALWNFMVR